VSKRRLRQLLQAAVRRFTQSEKMVTHVLHRPAGMAEAEKAGLMRTQSVNK
jgi:hypothetical protein